MAQAFLLSFVARVIQFMPSMSGRSFEDDNPRGGGWGGEWQDNSTAQDNMWANGDWSWYEGQWSGVEAGGGRGYRQRQEQYERSWEQYADSVRNNAAEAERAAVAESNVVQGRISVRGISVRGSPSGPYVYNHPGGQTPIINIPDTDLHQLVRQGCCIPVAQTVRGNRVIPDLDGILSAAESSHHRNHTAVDNAGASTAVAAAGACPPRGSVSSGTRPIVQGPSASENPQAEPPVPRTPVQLQTPVQAAAAQVQLQPVQQPLPLGPPPERQRQGAKGKGKRARERQIERMMDNDGKGKWSPAYLVNDHYLNPAYWINQPPGLPVPNLGPCDPGYSSGSGRGLSRGNSSDPVTMPTRECPTAVAGQALNEPQSMSMRTTELTAISVLKGEVISQMGARPSLARSESEDSLLQEIFNVEYFRDYPSPRGCEIHNHALKYFRHDAEKTGRDVVIFDNTDPVKMKEMVIASPTEFKFIGGPTTDWHWHELVAKLDDKSLVQVVEGWREDPNRSRGLINCRLQKTDRCDQTRDSAQKQQGVAGRILHTEEQLMIWDFVLVRANGTEVWLHPNYASENVECLEQCGPRSEVPKSGLGGTSVPGCPHVRAFGYPFCKHCKNKNLKTILHFKAN